MKTKLLKRLRKEANKKISFYYDRDEGLYRITQRVCWGLFWKDVYIHGKTYQKWCESLEETSKLLEKIRRDYILSQVKNIRYVESGD